MNLAQIAIVVAGWGLLALLLLSLAVARARAARLQPIPREQAPATTCPRCRLPFHRSSWKCGRCGAHLKPRLFYWIGRYVLEPLLALLVVPWILLVGTVLSLGLRLAERFMPRLVHRLVRFTNRLGVWVTPLFGRWVPDRWRMPIVGTTLLPNEVDAPEDVVVAASLTLGTAMLERSEEELQIWVPHPGEETLELLRQAAGGISEVWGYVPDGHTLVPSFTDQIIGALCRGEEILVFTDGLTNHLQTPLHYFEVRQVVEEARRAGRRRRRRRRRRGGRTQTGTGREDARRLQTRSEETPRSEKTPQKVAGTSEWKFVLRREPVEDARYPIRWEVHAEPEMLLSMQDRVTELETWDTLPCGLVID